MRIETAEKTTAPTEMLKAMGTNPSNSVFTPPQNPKNRERLRAVFYYKKGLLMQYSQALENICKMNATEIQHLQSVVLITKDTVGRFDKVVKMSNIRKANVNDKTETWFRSIKKNQNLIVIRGCIDSKVCLLQLCPQSGKGSLHYKTSEEAVESRDLLTKLDKSWGEMMTFEGTNCDLKNLVRFQRTVKSFLDVAES